MARISYIPYDAAREEEKVLDKLERAAGRTCRIDDKPSDLARFGRNNPMDAEFGSVDLLAQHLIDNDQTEFDGAQMACVNFRSKMPIPTIKAQLEAFGLTLKERAKVVRHRGVSDNPHDRWTAYRT